ncbi:MAG: 2OG-Fe(II) oxygenase family protein [Gammaproteobacteria bacterium]|nr:2OG-Fe(II) oxygenase family protein [Gammaproteobacteria bacterium]
MHSLRKDCFVQVPSSLSRNEIEAAAKGFLSFLSLPAKIRQCLHFPATVPRASADGYTDKVDLEHKDSKQFFHWKPALMERAPCQSLRQSEPVIEEFFQLAEHVYQKAEAILEEVYSQYLPQYYPQIFHAGRLIDGILRFLCYTPNPEGKIGAKGHFDKGFSTLALGDSAQGLRIGSCAKHPLTEVEYQDRQAIFMPAWMLFQSSDGQIKPAWHEVVSDSAKPVNAFCARWSIVFFSNDPNMQYTNWDDVHTPLH